MQEMGAIRVSHTTPTLLHYTHTIACGRHDPLFHIHMLDGGGLDDGMSLYRIQGLLTIRSSILHV